MPRLVKILLICITVIVLLLFSLQLTLDFYLNKKMSRELEATVSESSKGVYSLSIKKARVNIFNQTVSIGSLSLVADTTRGFDKTLYCLTTGKLKFENINIFSFLWHRDLKIQAIEFNNPSVCIYRSNDGVPVKLPDTSQVSLYKLISPYFNSISIKDIRVANSDVSLYQAGMDTAAVLHSNNNNLRIKNIVVSEQAEKSHRWFTADTFNVSINNFQYKLGNELYSVNCKNFFASYVDSLILLDSVSLVPLFGKRAFANAAGEQTDRMNVSADGLKFEKVDVKLFFEKSSLKGKKINIEGLTVSAYRDKNDNSISRKSNSLQKRIRNIPFYIAIDTIHVNNANVVYEEVAVGEHVPGKITFNKLDILVSGFNNDSVLSDKKITAWVKGLLMNKGRAALTYSFPLSTNETIFDCSGKLYPMPFTSLNPMLEPNVGLSVKNGEVTSLSFFFHADRSHSAGEMTLLYKDLKMDLVNKETNKTGPLKKIISILADGLILRNNNPEKNRPNRVGKIYYENPGDIFVFSYTWKSLLSGIKSTVGLSKKVTRD